MLNAPGTHSVFESLARWSRSPASPFRRFDLQGKSVLVSGGSRGLGLAIARELGGRGARLTLLARDERGLIRARESLVAEGIHDVAIAICDVTDKVEVQHAVVETVAGRGGLDVLVNVAGIIEVGPIEAMRKADFERAMATNFWGAFHLIEAVVPEMRAQGGGRIANVSSIGGEVAVPHLLPYVASKFALTGLSTGLRAELAKDGIGVVTICPGLMRTGSPVNATFKGNREAEYAWFTSADASPLFSTSAESAARRIARAIVRNEALVRITGPAKAAAVAVGLAPGLVSTAMTVANGLLPRSEDTAGAPGRESIPRGLPRWVTILSDRAAARNNEQRG
jgi:NAD(P)-dependent dehydrogenase (short-subunit alcohol dehydrogenase family)